MAEQTTTMDYTDKPLMTTSPQAPKAYDSLPTTEHLHLETKAIEPNDMYIACNGISESKELVCDTAKVDALLQVSMEHQDTGTPHAASPVHNGSTSDNSSFHAATALQRRTRAQSSRHVAETENDEDQILMPSYGREFPHTIGEIETAELNDHKVMNLENLPVGLRSSTKLINAKDSVADEAEKSDVDRVVGHGSQEYHHSRYGSIDGRREDDVSTTSWEINKFVDMNVGQHLHHIETKQSLRQLTIDNSTLEDRSGIIKLSTHQPLVGGDNLNTSQVNEIDSNINDARSTESSLPHVHYPLLLDQPNQQQKSVWDESISRKVGTTTHHNAINESHPISTSSYSSAYNKPCSTISFEDILTAAPVRSNYETSNDEHMVLATDAVGESRIIRPGYTRQVSGSSFLSGNSLGSNSLKRGNSLASDDSSTAQHLSDPSTKSFNDAFITHDEEGEFYNTETENNLAYTSSLSFGRNAADESRFTIALHPNEKCSPSVDSGAAPSDSITMMELQQALPMGESGDDENSHVQHYEFGHARKVEVSRGQKAHMPGIGLSKPFIPQTFPSLLDSSISSSYSVSASPSVTPSIDNFADVQNEGSKEEREDYATHAPTPLIGYIDDPLAIEVPLTMPIINDRSRFIVDLEQITEESLGQNIGERSASSPLSMSISTTKNSVGLAADHDDSNKKWESQHQKVTREDCIPITENLPMTTARSDQQNDHFFNYRHKYYTEQYHYFDEDNNPSKGGDDETDSTCSSVTLSQALECSVHSDDHSYDSSSFMTGSSSHPTLSTVSSVTLSQALSVDRHDHLDQGFYVAVRLGDYVEGQNDEHIAVESLTGDQRSRMNDEERDRNEPEEKAETDSKTVNDCTPTAEDNSNDPSEASTHVDTGDVFSDAPIAANKAITESNEHVESDILNMLIPDCGVPIPSVMSKMGKQRSKGGMLLPWHSTRSIQNYRYGGGRRKKNNNMSSNNKLFSISSVHTFRG